MDSCLLSKTVPGRETKGSLAGADLLRRSQLNKVHRHRSFHVVSWLPVIGRRDEERLGRIQTLLGELGAEAMEGPNCSRPNDEWMTIARPQFFPPLPSQLGVGLLTACCTVHTTIREQILLLLFAWNSERHPLL